LRAAKTKTDPQTRRTEIEGLVLFAETLIKDVQAGTIPPHRQAFSHLLTFFKESGVRDPGIRLWNWLEAQNHVDQAAYGNAIELLAIDGSSLSDLEALYQQALERFPEGYAQYHLSPEAIVQDAGSVTTIKGLPVTLLQGIITARLQRGDARNAYLGLDTMLRLFPDQIRPRIFQVFSEERPTLEAYTVFAIACRSGNALPSSQFRQLIGALRTGSDLSTPLRHAITVRSIVSALYLHVSAGGQITQNSLNEIVICMTLLMRMKGVETIDPLERRKISFALMDAIRALLRFYSSYGIQPGVTAFNSIITNIGGSGSCKPIIKVALTDMKALGLQPSAVTHRSIVTAAGSLEDSELLHKAWEGLVQGREASDTPLDDTDFYILIKNAKAAGELDFARQQLEKYKATLTEENQNRLSEALNEEPSNVPETHDASKSLDPALLSEQIELISADLQVMQQSIRPDHKVQDLRDVNLPMVMLPVADSSAQAERHMRRVYDSLMTEQGLLGASTGSSTALITGTDDADSLSPSETTITEDAHDAPSTDDASIISQNGSESAPERKEALSPTNIPFSTLRYENWKTINQLLEFAEVSDNAYLATVDAAIAAAHMPPQRTLGLDVAHHKITRSYGLSDAVQVEMPGSGIGDEEGFEQARDEILRLRGRSG